MKTIKFKYIFIIIIMFLTSCVDDKNKITIVDDETFYADEENEKLKLVFDKAQDSLDYFISELMEHTDDTSYWFSAKTKFENHNEVIHIWFNTIGYKKNKSFIGILHNEVDWSDTFETGDTISVYRNNIEDWYIENESKNMIKGDFTEKILFGKE